MRIGAACRAVRVRRGWRQKDVAVRAGVSAATISRLERGHVGTLTVETLRRILGVLEIRLDLIPRWRGGELDRMLNAGHAALHEAAAQLFRRLPTWRVAVEVTFAIYGERGAIDILAFHPASGSLLVVELKSDLVDIQALITAVDRYRRLAPQIARDRGWQAATVSVWVAMRETDANRRRVNAHSAVLGGGLPGARRGGTALAAAP